MRRRDFLKSAVLSTTSAAMGHGCSTRMAPGMVGLEKSSNRAILPRREYGKTGVRLSVIGLGGIVVKDVEQERVDRIVGQAIDLGVNYFDVAPAYGDAEIRLGQALEPHRKRVFLACKTARRRRQGVGAELERSLERLRTDYFDLYQLHGLNDVGKDVDIAFAKGGALEVLVEAKKAGVVRYLGFSAHSVEAAFAAMDRFDFDSVMFPINFACYYEGGFGEQVVEKAQTKGAARLALKAMARQRWPADDPLRERFRKLWYQPITDRYEAELALRFTLNQPVTAAIPPGDENLFRLAVDLAMDLAPIAVGEEQKLRTLAATLNPVFPPA